MRRLVLLAVLSALTLSAALLSTADAAPPGAVVVMSGLDNPRGLAVSGGGKGWKLYVAEAGEGGSGPCIDTGDPGRPIACYGPSGAISVLHRGTQRRVVTGMPSNALPNGGGAHGPHDLSRDGAKYATIGMGANPMLRPGFGPGGVDFGKLVRLTGHGWRAVADLAAFEAAHNPVGPPDTNPYGLVGEGGTALVTDAGGNDLLRVGANGGISLIAVLPSRPDRPTDSVPTAVVRGPDGVLRVAELSGVPFLTGTARIYRIVNGAAQVWLEGFTTIIDLEYACDGTLYVLEHSSAGPFFAGPGRVMRVEPDGTRTTAFGGLERPAAIVFGPDGKLYISNRGHLPNVGEVLRVEVGEEACTRTDD
jgi:hypothetical protein